jgi:serine/threonine protein kinase
MSSADLAAPELPPQYVIKKHHTSAGMADIWFGEEVATGQRVVVKCLPNIYTPSSDLYERFLRERSWSQHFGGSCSPRVLESIDSPPGFIMEYVGSATLKEVINERQCDLAEGLHWASSIARLMTIVHGAGIVFRDVKPQNFLVDSETGQMWVIDFGIVYDLTLENQLTADGRVVGTTSYVSPEQALGKRVDARSDIYSLGVVMFEMFAGRELFSGEGQVATAVKHVREPAPRLSEIRSDLPDWLVDLVADCLEKNPDHRPQSAHDVSMAIEMEHTGWRPQKQDWEMEYAETQVAGGRWLSDEEQTFVYAELILRVDPHDVTTVDVYVAGDPDHAVVSIPISGIAEVLAKANATKGAGQ